MKVLRLIIALFIALVFVQCATLKSWFSSADEDKMLCQSACAVSLIADKACTGSRDPYVWGILTEANNLVDCLTACDDNINFIREHLDYECIIALARQIQTYKGDICPVVKACDLK